MNKNSLIEFPCYFPIKIIGIHSDAFIQEVKALTMKHFPDFTDKQISQNNSKQSNYLAITLTVYALNQEMLDAFYKDISKLSGIKMVL